MRDAGIFVLRESFLMAHAGRVHFLGGRHRALEPHDRTIVECLVRAEARSDALADGLRRRGMRGSATMLLRDLGAEAAAGHSALRRVPLPPVDPADVVLLDFSEGSAVDGAGLAAELRRERSVLHVGLGPRVSGGPRARLCLERAWTEDPLSAFEFLQVARAIARASCGTLVLCGETDAILFGDLVASRRTDVFVDRGWPGHFPAEESLLPETPGVLDACLETLFYAMRCMPAKDWPAFSRRTNLSFARLENLAIRHASTALCSCQDQPPALARMRAGRETRLVSFRPLQPTAETRGVAPGHLAVLADVERDWQELGELLSVLMRSARDCGCELRLFVLSHGTWMRVSDGGGEILVEPAKDSTLALERFPVALAVPVMLRNVQPALDALMSGVRTFFAPTASALPLLAAIPEELRLDELSLAVFRSRLLPHLGVPAPSREHGAPSLRALDPVRCILEACVAPGS